LGLSAGGGGGGLWTSSGRAGVGEPATRTGKLVTVWGDHAGSEQKRQRRAAAETRPDHPDWRPPNPAHKTKLPPTGYGARAGLTVLSA